MVVNKKTQRLSALARGVFVALLMFATLFPFYWTLLISLKNQNDAFQVPPDLIFVPTMENYLELFVNGDFGRFFLNSFIVCFFPLCWLLRWASRRLTFLPAVNSSSKKLFSTSSLSPA